jgi:hypothetical protein
VSRTSRPLWLRLPLWARWGLSLIVAIALVVALVVFVDRHNNDNLAPESPTAALRANREAEIVVSQDQAPHVVKLAATIPPKAAFTRVIRAEMNNLLAHGEIDGPFDRVTCATAGSGPGVTGYRCTGEADDVNYIFLGVTDQRAHRITYCKRDPPPIPSENIPISRRCQT